MRDRKAARWRTVAPRRVIRGKVAPHWLPRGEERQRGRDVGQVAKVGRPPGLQRRATAKFRVCSALRRRKEGIA